MKVLQLIETGGPGGAERVLLDLVSGLLSRNIECVVGMLRDGWLSENLRKRGVQYRILPAGGHLDVKLIKSILYLIRKGRCTVIHSHLLDMNFYSAIASKLSRAKHVCTEHGDIRHISKSQRKNKLKAKVISKLSDRIVFVSKCVQKDFVKATPVKSCKGSVIYNGIDTRLFVPINDMEKYSLRESLLGVKRSRDVLFVNVGNLYPVKDQETLLKSFKIVQSRLPNSRLLILGRGSQESYLKRIVQELNISNFVVFMGHREDVDKLLKVSDVFVLSSLSEGLPLSLIEAMACGLPAIVTKVGGIPEVVRAGREGFLVEPGNIDALAHAMTLLGENPVLRQDLSVRSRSRVLSKFSLEMMLDSYEKLYRELV